MRVAVVGGGLAGLVVALRRSQSGDDVTLYEVGQRLGGQIETERSQGFVVEHGAEGFVAGSEALLTLAQSLEIQQELIDQLTLVSYVFDGRSLVALAPGEAARKLGFQVPNAELGRGIRSFRFGMAELTEALAQKVSLRASIRLGCGVERLEPRREAYRLGISGALAEDFEQVVLATPASVAGSLLEPLIGAVAGSLRQSKMLSSVTVSLAYPRLAIDHPLDGSGFIVAEDQRAEGFRACAFVSSKLADRAPPDQALLRLFFRPERTALEHDSDKAWTLRAARCAARALRVSGNPARAWVSRWPDALPVFDPERTEAVQAVEAALASQRVRLAGAAFHGSGIDAAVRSAERTASCLDH